MSTTMTTQSLTANSRFNIPRAAYGLLAILVVVAVAGVTTPSFATFHNALVIIRAASITGIVAIAMSYITISGNLFALSASSLGALLAVLYALTTAHFGFAAGIALTLGIACLAGVSQGLAISLIGNPIIRLLQRIWVPRFISALLVLTLGLTGTALLAQQLFEPAGAWMQQLPRELREITPGHFARCHMAKAD